MTDLLVRLRRWLLKQQFFTSVVLPAIPRGLRWRLRKIYFAPADLMEKVSGGQDSLAPSKSQVFTGAPDGFGERGDHLVQRLAELTELSTQARVLDVGSGMGRLAVALTRYLGDNGSYEGLDKIGRAHV